MSVINDHASLLLERVERAQASTRRITSTGNYDNETLTDNDNMSSPSIPYKEQLRQAQRALVSSQEASQMRYEKLQNEKSELESQNKKNADIIQRLEFTVSQLTMEIENMTVEVTKQASNKRWALEERNEVLEKLERVLAENEEKDDMIQQLSKQNESLRKQLSISRQKKQLDLRLEYSNQQSADTKNDSKTNCVSQKSDVYWV